MYDYAALFVWLLLAIISVSLVFLVIIGVTVTAIMKKICSDRPDWSAQAGGSAQTAVQTLPSAMAAAPVALTAAPSEEEDEITAVISAAVAVVFGESARITAITPSAAPSRHGVGFMWRASGRLQNFEGFSDL